MDTKKKPQTHRPQAPPTFTAEGLGLNLPLRVKIGPTAEHRRIYAREMERRPFSSPRPSLAPGASSVSERDCRVLAEAVRTYLLRHGVFGLSDGVLCHSIDFLRRREAEATTALTRDRARVNLSAALSGLHPPKHLTEGRPAKSSDENLVQEKAQIQEHLEELVDAFRNLDLVSARVSDRWGIPRKHATEIVRMHLRRERPQFWRATMRILAVRSGRSHRTIERPVAKRGEDLWLLGYANKISRLRSGLRDFLKCKATRSRDRIVVRTLSAREPEIVSRWRSLSRKTIERHLAGLSSRGNFEYYLDHAGTLEEISAMWAVVSSHRLGAPLSDKP